METEQAETLKSFVVCPSNSHEFCSLLPYVANAQREGGQEGTGTGTLGAADTERPVLGDSPGLRSAGTWRRLAGRGEAAERGSRLRTLTTGSSVMAATAAAAGAENPGGGTAAASHRRRHLSNRLRRPQTE